MSFYLDDQELRTIPEIEPGQAVKSKLSNTADKCSGDSVFKFKRLDNRLNQFNGRIDVHLIDYDNNQEDPDIFIFDDITRDEVHRLNNQLDNSLEMQVYCDDELIYVE